ncbi:ImmA/IrrE family metallo-endopeptidase [Clostridium baratii]|uniref:ImmA/IrrE family metallo-endopeptidase n=1 Tax=Clostridium baratii TaxID=1561 RepID=UPI0030D02246
MESNEIIQLAKNLKELYGNNPIDICNKLNIKINYIKLRPSIYPAYTIKLSEKPVINLNSHFTDLSQKVLCAHELGHALMHEDKLINEFNDDNNGIYEYEANLFAVSLLFNEKDFNIEFSNMDNYLLKGLLDMNIKLR